MNITSTPSSIVGRLLNPIPITYNFHGSDVPHPDTQRRLYQVPTGKRAILYDIYCAIEMLTAPSAIGDREITFDFRKGIDYDVELWSLHFTETSNTVRAENHFRGPIDMETDSELRAATVDFSTGGSAIFTFHAALLQYDVA